MDVELIFKIAAVGIIVAVLTQLLIRSVLTLIVSQISGLFKMIKQLFGF